MVARFATGAFWVSVIGLFGHAVAGDGMEEEEAPGFLAPRRLSLQTDDFVPWFNSCIDPSLPRDPIPWEQSHYGNHYGITLECEFGVRWEISPHILQMMKDNGAKAHKFSFKVCWAANIDKLFRWWPWLRTSGDEWRYDLAALSSTQLTPYKLTEIWHDGYQNVIPDALDYYARMGEVNGRKIIPKFMLFGWSKGATYNWPLGRWRSDIVQASIITQGCDTKRYWVDPRVDEKAHGKGVGPYLFTSAEDDGYLDCSHQDTLEQVAGSLQYASHIYHVITQCGHHPIKCWPGCNLTEIFNEPFWEFVDMAYQYAACTQWDNKAECEEVWCKWDSALSVCGELHPTNFTPSCEKFCGLQEVKTSCSAVDIDVCNSSYRVLPIEEATPPADGMHVMCEPVDGECQESSEEFQCFFQDRCPE